MIHTQINNKNGITPIIRPLNVLFVISNLEYGGAQRQIIELANNIDPELFNVYICSLSEYIPLSNLLSDSNTKLHIIKKRFKYDITVIPRLAKLMRQLNIDIVHNFLFDAEISGRLAAYLSNVGNIISSERNTNYRLKKRQLIAYRLTRSLVDLVIANSNAGAQFNSRTLGINPSKYKVVHNGVDIQKFAPGEGSHIRKELGIACDERVIGMFASLKHQKNHPLFFHAAHTLLQVIPNARFLIVGDMLHAGMHGSDDYKIMINKLVDDLGIRDRCIFLGNRDDVSYLYLACDITVLPSHFEGTPNVLLESMACGVPVIATDVSDNAFIAPDNKVGYIIPAGEPNLLSNKIMKLLLDETLRQNMGKEARAWVVSNFSSRSLAAKYQTIYLDIFLDKTTRSQPHNPPN